MQRFRTFPVGWFLLGCQSRLMEVVPWCVKVRVLGGHIARALPRAAKLRRASVQRSRNQTRRFRATRRKSPAWAIGGTSSHEPNLPAICEGRKDGRASSPSLGFPLGRQGPMRRTPIDQRRRRHACMDAQNLWRKLSMFHHPLTCVRGSHSQQKIRILRHDRDD